MMIATARARAAPRARATTRRSTRSRRTARHRAVRRTENETTADETDARTRDRTKAVDAKTREMGAAKPFDVEATMAKMASYDWLSSGCGAVLCAGFFHWRGESLGAALGVACVATIASVVIEELLEDRDQPWV